MCGEGEGVVGRVKGGISHSCTTSIVTSNGLKDALILPPTNQIREHSDLE